VPLNNLPTTASFHIYYGSPKRQVLSLPFGKPMHLKWFDSEGVFVTVADRQAAVV
jgi:hypothetical protein